MLHLVAQLYGFQTGAVFKEIVRDTLNAIADSGGKQGLTAVEGTGAQGGHTVGDVDALHLRAASEGSLADDGATLVDGHRGDVDTVSKYIGCHLLEASAQFYLCQGSTADEGIAFHLAYATRPVDVAEARTVAESAVANLFNVASKCYSSEVGTILKCIVAYSFHRVRRTAVSDGGGDGDTTGVLRAAGDDSYNASVLVSDVVGNSIDGEAGGQCAEGCQQDRKQCGQSCSHDFHKRFYKRLV